MLYNPVKQTYDERIKMNRLPKWMEDRHWLRGYIVVRDMRTADNERGRFTAYFLPRSEWLPLIKTLNKRAGAEWPVLGDYSTAQMIGETDLNGVWLGWTSNISTFESALIDAGCLDRYKAPLLSDYQLRTQASVIESDTAISDIERVSVRKERIRHSQWAEDIKARAAGRCQLLPVLSRNLVAGHIKPWSLCEEGEHLDRANGLCLSPSLDKLFESGAIGLTDEGNLIVNGLSEDELQTYGLTEDCSVSVAEGQHCYLRWHREQVMKLE